MVSPVLYEHYYDGAFLVSEAEGHRSRDAGVMANTTSNPLPLDGGLVVTQAVAGAVTAAPKTGGNTGNGSIGALSAGLGAQVGNYVVTFTGATTFDVFAPNGTELEHGSTGVAYSDGVNFTITAGGTAFVAGDGFTVTVAAGNAQWAPFTSATPAQNLGILFQRIVIGANSTKNVTVITREAQVNREELQWDPSVTAAGGITGAAVSGNTGNGTIGSLSIVSAQLTGGVDAFVPTGTYTLTAISPTEFMVADPTGQDLGVAVVGTAFADEIGLTITAGSTAFAEGDAFTVTVTNSGMTQALAALASAGIIAR